MKIHNLPDLRYYTDKRVIVSLTSFPAAIQYAYGAIQSILNGNLLPDKIVLYLVTPEFENSEIPDYLTNLSKSNPIFEIRFFDRRIRSYTKLIPAIQDFPEDIIVTIDDDNKYHPNMLRSLLKMHKKFPDYIIANRTKLINPDKPYKNWKKFRWYHFLLHRYIISPKVLLTGVGGVLYPPHSLKEDMLDPDIFSRIAPTTDDLWFWAASVANGRYTICVPFAPYNKPKGLDKPKEIALKSVNFKKGTHLNDTSFKSILDHYPELNTILKPDYSKH